ncbi:MAG: UDP-N-acetylmuramate:L-alanyl-gamma-D-glutamyl-meso-diaminopimelate ligase [Acidobacteria bacterium]|nr:UDP-N-acetylmuramate:L-alanyl-gamma-D-glutamyl-meso-diaminopimelate ligase [Acidobacteriota bacterium]
MPQLREIDSRLEKVYLVGICGTAMASLAGMLKERGFQVTGSDEHVYPPMSTYLESLGIGILEGYTGEHLERFRPDLVVIGNAIAKGNAEALHVLERDLPYTSMPEAIHALFIRGKHSIVVAGTHGKTTTTSLLAWMLEAAGHSPSFVVGGIPLNFNQNYRLGRGAEFVIEGDEYNTAFFDKGPKFVHYRADTLILNNIEFDHADIFDGLEAVVDAFRLAVAGVDEKGMIVANGDDPIVNRLRADAKAKWVTFGFGAGCDWQARDVGMAPGRTSFTVAVDGRDWLRVSTPLSGMHNVTNALANIAVAHSRGIGHQAICDGLGTFLGIKRRMEVRGVVRGVTVIDDFAHHPTAIETTLRGARDRYPGARIFALFEPRSISSSRREFEGPYKQAFLAADRVVLGPVFHRQRYVERYGIDKMMSVEAILETLRSKGVPADQIDDFDEIARLVAHEARDGDVVIAMSSGAFGGVHEKVIEALAGSGKESAPLE